jgi:hypothetical protein
LPKFLPHRKALPYEIEVAPSSLNCSFLTHVSNSLCNISTSLLKKHTHTKMFVSVPNLVL